MLSDIFFHAGSEGGLILVRDLDEHLGLSQLIEQHLTDLRGTNTRLRSRRVAALGVCEKDHSTLGYFAGLIELAQEMRIRSAGLPATSAPAWAESS